MASATFTTIAQPDAGGLLVIEVPETVVRSLGEKQRVPVRVTLNGVRYRSTVAVYGGRYYLPARRTIREAAKLARGKRARVTLEVDLAPHSGAAPRSLGSAHEGRREGCVQGDVVLAAARARGLGDERQASGDARVEVARVVADALARSRAARAR